MVMSWFTMYITLTLLVDFYTHLLFGYNLQENPILLRKVYFIACLRNKILVGEGSIFNWNNQIQGIVGKTCLGYKRLYGGQCVFANVYMHGLLLQPWGIEC